MKLRLLIVLFLVPMTSACSYLMTGENLQQRSGASSSLVDYLYPNNETPPLSNGELPQLQLPLRVGIAFVPTRGQSPVSATEQQQLLQRVADAFADRPFVSAIEVIPEIYLRNARGHAGMRQVASMFNVEAMALVSYDQLVLSRERDSSLLYWTVVGAMVVKGNNNEVQTLIDTAVFDVKSSRLLLRAPGVHSNQRNTTLIDDANDRRQLQQSSFGGATEDMISNLSVELDAFRESVKQGERAQVAWRSGGGGGFGPFGLALLLLSIARINRRQSTTTSSETML